MDRTKIEWTAGPDGRPGATWNPIRAAVPHNGTFDRLGWHCVHASGGCKYCYSEALNQRLGTGLPYHAQSKPESFVDDKLLTQPLHWRRPRRIFVASMSDLFGEWVSDEWLDRIFAIMALCPRHTFLVLTKRAKRMREYLSQDRRDARAAAADALVEAGRLTSQQLADWSHRWRTDEANNARWSWSAFSEWPMPNLWAGVSVEDQPTADDRIPELLLAPAAVRWVSYEPALAEVDFQAIRWDDEDAKIECNALTGEAWVVNSDSASAYTNEADGNPKLDWIVVGGESGPYARPFNIEWAHRIVAQCRAAKTACFVKQLGSNPHAPLIGPFKCRDRKGGEPAEWPADLRIREYPTPRSSAEP